MSPLLALVFAPSTLVLGAVTPQPDGWRLETADTSLVVSAEPDGPVIRSLRARGDGHEWAARPMRVPLLRSVTVAGVARRLEWRLLRADADPGTGKAVLEYVSEEPALVLTSVWRAREGRGPVEHWMGIINRSGQTVTLASQPSLTLRGLRVPGDAGLWWIRRGGSNASTQGGTFAEPVRPGLDLDLVSNPEDGASPVPWAAVQCGEERGLYVGWEFSGIGSVRASVGDEGTLRLDVGNREDFTTDLPAGETFEVPTAFVGCYRGDIDEGAYSLHRFILEKLRPPMPEGYPDPTLAYNLYLDAGGNQAREEDVLRSARVCADLGFETFVPDAMWFPQPGDWRWDPSRFPRGVGPIEKLTHDSGMRMGLWCAWTNAGNSDDPGALSAHRQTGWFNEYAGSDWQPGPFWGIRLCLACDDAREWATRETQRIVRAFRLDYLKHDISPIATTCNHTNHRHRGASDVSYWATLGYYRVMDQLVSEFPGLALENCSGGGHIKDFGVMQRSHYTVTTDTLSNLPDRQSIYDSTYAFPPLVLQAYTYDNYYAVEGDEPGPFLWRSAMMSAWQIDPTDAVKWGPEERTEVQREVGIYTRWVRPILHDAKIHHILPRPDGVNWDGLFLWSPSLRRGALYAFRPASDEAEQTIPLKGLETRHEYWVWAEDGALSPRRVSGRELMAEGLLLRLPARYSCDLVYVQDAAEGQPEGLEGPDAFRLETPELTDDPFEVSARLGWERSAGARSYRLVVSENADLSAPVVAASLVLPTYSCTSLRPAAKYHWSVTAAGWGGTTPCVERGSFTTPGLEATPGVSFLSTREWVSANAGADNPVRRDTNYPGKVPSVGGKRLARALWTHAYDDATPADIVFDVSGEGSSEFRATVGPDDASGAGSVEFKVLLDGNVVAESPVLRHGESHEFAVPLAGAGQLTLRVLNGGDGYACDHAVWGFARLVESGVTDPCE